MRRVATGPYVGENVAEAVASDLEVALPAVGADFAAAGDVIEHEVRERVLGAVWDPSDPHALGHLLALDGDRDDCLARSATPATACPPSPSGCPTADWSPRACAGGAGTLVAPEHPGLISLPVAPWRCRDQFNPGCLAEPGARGARPHLRP